MVDEAYRHFPLETGGLLLGRTSPERRVTCVIGPGPSATHQRFNFDPDQRWQEDAVAAAWDADRELEYLGDWHTHPNGRPRLSKLDVGALAAIRASPEARVSTPLMLILAVTADGDVRVRARELGARRRLRTVEVRVVPSDDP